MTILLALLGTGAFLIFKYPLFLIGRFFGWILVGWSALLILKLLS